MKKLIFLLLFVLFPAVLHAADAERERPYWSLEVKGGRFTPDIEGWTSFYGSRSTGEYGASLSYKLLRQVEFGIEGLYMRESGKGFEPGHSALAGTDVMGGDVTYEATPLNAFILLRGIFTEKQWIVPYAGGGWTRMFYRAEVQDQGVVRGAVDGYHARAGLQFLLDGIDPSAANSFYLDYGVQHTYLFLEAEYTHAMVDTTAGGVNLGGTAYLGGLLFEF